MEKLEKLLNKLVEKGWKPYGMEHYDRFIIESAGDMCFRWKYPGADGENAFDYNYDYFKIRELVSKESGLWQFVCENALYSYTNCVWKGCEGPVVVDYIEPQSYKYRVIESALKDESELEKFLLDNIKIDE